MRSFLFPCLRYDSFYMKEFSENPTAESATNPRQYDSENLNWQVSGAEDSLSRIAFREALDTIMPTNSLRGKSVVDVGCGVGQLFNWLQRKGVSHLVGIDPAERNVRTSKEIHPAVAVEQATLREYSENNPGSCDVAIAIMVFEHIQDLHGAFNDLNTLLREGGEFYLIIGDKDFHLLNDTNIRGGRFKRVEILKDLGESAVETKTIRGDREDGSYKELHDIFRDMTKVRDAAEANNFDILEEKPILGPLSIPLSERTILVCHSFRFKKRNR